MVALFALDRCDALGVREWAYLRANDAYLGRVGAPPDAVEVARESMPYTSADSGIIYIRPDGWNTQVILAAPPSMSEQDLRSFYASQFASGWRQDDLVIGTAGASLDDHGRPVSTNSASFVITRYCRDGGFLSFDYERLAQDGTYAIIVDHAQSVC